MRRWRRGPKRTCRATTRAQQRAIGVKYGSFTRRTNALPHNICARQTQRQWHGSATNTRTLVLLCCCVAPEPCERLGPRVVRLQLLAVVENLVRAAAHVCVHRRKHTCAYTVASTPAAALSAIHAQTVRRAACARTELLCRLCGWASAGPTSASRPTSTERTLLPVLRTTERTRAGGGVWHRSEHTHNSARHGASRRTSSGSEPSYGTPDAVTSSRSAVPTRSPTQTNVRQVRVHASSVCQQSVAAPTAQAVRHTRCHCFHARCMPPTQHQRDSQ